MVNPKDFKVSTTAQLLGANAPKQYRTGRGGPVEVKTAMRINKPLHEDKSREILKAVRFTPSTKGSKGTKEIEDLVAASAKEGIRIERKTVLVTKPTIKVDTSFLSPKIQPVNEAGRETGDTRVFEIYFAPVEANRSSTELSSPKEILRDSSVSNKVSQQDQQGGADIETITSPIFIGNSDEKFSVTYAQLDRLASALAKSPMIRDHVQRHWWNSNSNITNLEDTSPSAPTIYSQPNRQFILRPLSFANPLPESPILAHYTSPSPSHLSDVTSLAITDPYTHGSPVRFLSRPLLPTSSVGSCTYINLPYGSTIESTIRIEDDLAVASLEQERRGKSHNNATQPKKAVLQITSRILDRKSNRRGQLLVSEVDISSELRSAALAELANTIGRPIGEIAVGAEAPVTFSAPLSSRRSSGPITIPSSSSIQSAEEEAAAAGEEQVDWITLADGLQRTSELADAVDSVAERLKSLRVSPSTSPDPLPKKHTPPTQETKSFLAHVDHLRKSFSHFWILKPGKDVHESSGIPKTMGVPWVSGTLAVEIGERKWNDCDEVLSTLVERVTKVWDEGHEFTDTLRGERVRFVPVFGDAAAKGVGAWVCFLQGLDLGKG